MVEATTTNPRLHLLGHLAQRNGLLEPAQLEECVAAQVATRMRLGPVLVTRGHLDREQLESLRAQVLTVDDPPHRLGSRDTLLARLVRERELASAEGIQQALREHALLEAEGVVEPFCETLSRLGLLTGFQRILLNRLSKVSLFCDLCEQHYEVEGLPEKNRMRCPECRAPLRAPTRKDPPAEQPKSLLYDSVQASEIALFIQSAVKQGFCSREQLVQASEHRAKECPLDDLGDVLVSLGVLEPSQLDAVDDLRQSGMQRRDLRRRKRTQGCTFGRVGLMLGYYSRKVLDQVLAKEPVEGKPSLSERMVQSSFLTAHQVSRIEHYRGDSLFCCEPCGKPYDLPGEPQPTPPPCPHCQGPLSKTDLFDVAQMVQKLVWPGGKASPDSGRMKRPTEGEDESKAMDEVRKRFSEFYDDMPELQERSNSGRMLLPEAATDNSLLSDDQVIQQINVRVAPPKVIQPPSRTGLRLSLLIATLVLLIAGGWISARVLLKPPPPVGSAAAEIADAEEAAKPTRPIKAGDLITLSGEIPWGKQWHIVNERIQGFCLRTPDGKLWWIVDTKGRSFMSLGALSNPQFEKHPFYVKVDAKVASGSIPELAPPESVKPTRQLILSRWERVHTAPAANGYLIKR